MLEGIKRYGEATIAEACQRLQAGELVAVPTETVYGLAADSTKAESVASIYRAKGRPDFNPLIVHIPNLEAARRLAQFNPLALTLAEKFWPGPLTLVLPRTSDCPVAPAVTAGLDTIAIRCPAHSVMQELLALSGLYLAAPSANKSGGISPTAAEHVQLSLGESAPMILDGGPSEQGLESTIVAIRDGGYQILRSGPVTAEELIAITAEKPMLVTDQKIEAPGQLASHYAPSKSLRLNAIQAESDEFLIGYGTTEGDFNLSPAADLAEAAANLFTALHLADTETHPRIAVVSIPENGIGAAINDRLRRAAVKA